MNFNQKSVCADSDGASAQDRNEVGSTGSLTRVHDYREVGFPFCDCNRGKVERVAGICLESSDPALAQQNARVAVRENIFRGQKLFFDPFAHSAFQQNRFPGFCALDQ